MKLKIDVLSNGKKPKVEYDTKSNCMDIASANDNGTIIIEPQTTKNVPTGIRLEIEQGYIGHVKARSSITNLGLVITGTIDSDFRGNINIQVHNIGTEPINIEPGQYIAQIAFIKNADLDIEFTSELSITKRGDNGFGSTNVPKKKCSNCAHLLVETGTFDDHFTTIICTNGHFDSVEDDKTLEEETTCEDYIERIYCDDLSKPVDGMKPFDIFYTIDMVANSLNITIQHLYTILQFYEILDENNEPIYEHQHFDKFIWEKDNTGKYILSIDKNNLYLIEELIDSYKKT